MPPHPTIADVIRGYSAEKAREEWYGEWGAAMFYRPAAILLTPLFLRLSISATSVTLLSLAIAASLPVLAFSGGPGARLAVPLLAILVGILDCVDGGIARATGTASRRGQYLDFLTGVVFRLSFYAAIGLVADRLAPSPAWLAGNALALAILAAWLSAGARLCRSYVELLTGDRTGERPGAPRRQWKLGNYVFSFLSGLDSLTPLAMLAALYAGVPGWLVLWLVAYSLADFLHSQHEILKKIG